MKQFACGDVVSGCTATWQLPTEDEILLAVTEHARADHGFETVPPDVVDAVRSHIVTTTS